MSKLKFVLFIILLVATSYVLMGCDRVNNMNRSMDTMLGGDYRVKVLGEDEPYVVFNGKITSVPDKGYYVFYPMIDGEKRLVQSPIQITTIIKLD